MKKLLLSAALLAGLGFVNNASALECAEKAEAKASAAPAAVPATTVAAPVDNGTYAVGDVKIALPPPDASYVEMPAAMRSGMEATLPPQSRLLSAYVNKNDPTGMTSASVQTLKPLEQATPTTADFGQMVAQTKTMMGNTSLQDAIKSIDKNNPIAGQPKILGILFERENIFATAMLISANTPNGPVQIAVGSSMMLVKGKMTALVITLAYKDEKTIDAMKTELDAWTTKIAEGNK